ncbi:MAG: hypothetical protein AB7U75_13820 [Hyphomicrobiaceae bacterium]
MGGTLVYGSEDKIVDNLTPEVVTEVVDKRDLITVTELPPSILEAFLLDDPIYQSTLVQTDFDAVVEDTALELTIVYAPYTPTEYESTLLMLYQEYGAATVSKTLFTEIEYVVNVLAPDATYGIV